LQSSIRSATHPQHMLLIQFK